MLKKRSKKKGTEQNFWQSYSDMMAALLLVFVLIIAVSVTQAKANYEKKEAERAAAELEAKQAKEAALEQQKLYEERAAEQEIKIAEQQDELDSVLKVKEDIIQKLQTEFTNSNSNITIDPETGTIRFDSSILFDVDKSNLTSEGIQFLNEFFPKYFNVILSEGIRDNISEVIIEGHCDNDGSYLHNLDLSQNRAFAVAEYCLGEKSNMFSPEDLEQIRELVTANGRSYYGLIYKEDGEVDKEQSRRVEVKFRLTEEEMMERMQAILDKAREDAE